MTIAFGGPYSGEQQSLADERLEEMEKFVRGELSADDAEALRASMSVAHWMMLGERKRKHDAEIAATAVDELIAECSAPLGRSEGTLVLTHRTNRLLVAILRKLSEPRP